MAHQYSIFFPYHRISSYLRVDHSVMIPLYGTAPGFLSSKGRRFYLLLQTNLLTYWDLVSQYNCALTSGRENHREAFCNTVQGVYSGHSFLSWFCNIWRCQIKHEMLLFRLLCALHSVGCSAGLWRSSLVVPYHIYFFEPFDCDSSW